MWVVARRASGQYWSRPKSAAKSAPKATSKSATKSASKSATKSMPKAASKSASKSATKSVPKAASKSASKSATKSVPKSAAKGASKAASKSAPKSAAKGASKAASKSAPKQLNKPITWTDISFLAPDGQKADSNFPAWTRDWAADAKEKLRLLRAIAKYELPKIGAHVNFIPSRKDPEHGHYWQEWPLAASEYLDEKAGRDPDKSIIVEVMLDTDPRGKEYMRPTVAIEYPRSLGRKIGAILLREFGKEYFEWDNKLSNKMFLHFVD